MLGPNRLRMANGKRAIRRIDRKSHQGARQCDAVKCLDVARDETSKDTRVVTRKITGHPVSAAAIAFKCRATVRFPVIRS